MRWHALSETELLECLNLEPEHSGISLIGGQAALDVWRRLIRNLSFNSAVFVAAKASSSNRILAFGACVFVESDFATRELQDPQPRLSARIVESISVGRSVLVAGSDLYLRSIEKGLDVVCLYGNYRSDLTPPELLEVQMLLPKGLSEVLAGYRLNRILQESVGEEQYLFLQSSAVWQVAGVTGAGRALHMLTRDYAFSVSGSLAQAIFTFEEPVLRLRDCDKQLLAEALQGGSDQDLAVRLHLALPSVKKRWQAVFDRVRDANVEVSTALADSSFSGSRGLQKRHHILSYVRSRPSELRPYHLYS